MVTYDPEATVRLVYDYSLGACNSISNQSITRLVFSRESGANVLAPGSHCFLRAVESVRCSAAPVQIPQLCVTNPCVHTRR